MITRLRPFLLAILAALTGAGIIPEPVAERIQSSPTESLAVTLVAWALIAAYRNYRDSTAAQETS